MTLIKNYLYNVGYQIFILIVPLITVPYTSRVLGSEGIGINAFTNSIIQYFILFGSIGINLYGNRTVAYCRDSKEKLSKTFWEISIVRMIFITISYIAFLVFLFFIKEYRTFYFYQSILILAAGFDISWFFMGLEDFKKTVTRNIVIKITSIVLIFLFIKNESDLGLYILMLSCSTLLGNLTLWPYLKSILEKVDWRSLKIFQHVRPSLALFVPQIATQIYLILNKTMLGLLTNINDVAYYEQSDKIVKMVLAIVTATGTVMLPRVANVFSKGNKEKVEYYLQTSFEFVSLISFPLAFGLSAIAPKFSIWFLGDDFKPTATLMSVLAFVIIAIGWSNVLGTQYLLPTNQTTYYTTSVVVGAITNLVINLIFIHFFGVIGAVYATIISESLVTGTQIFFVRRTLEVKELFKETWKYLVASLLMFAIVRLVHVNTAGSLLNFVIQVVMGAIIYGIALMLIRVNIIERVRSIIEKKR